ncbi:MAG: hypothetical protein D9V47_09485 [Clostridia bacterium]|nr:MAG: hypothetical protein D9V47_09485 [Clostridia bacterium]
MAVIAEYCHMRTETRNAGVKEPGWTTAGFTLAEVISVACIMAIVSALSWPYLAGTLAHYRLVTSAQEIASAIRLVQQRAITESFAGYYINFNATLNRYELHLDKDDLLGSFERRYLPKGVKIAYVKFGSSPLSRLTFSATGVPVEGGGTVRLETASGDKYYVVVTPVTGRVRARATQ